MITNTSSWSPCHRYLPPMAEENDQPRPHAVLVPFPAQGHMNPMLKLAKLLHQRGFHVTFANTEFNHRRLLQSLGAGDLEGLPRFHFAAIPSPDYDLNNHSAMTNEIRTNCLAPFRSLVIGINNSGLSNVPPVTCIISDPMMDITIKVAKEFNIPFFLLWVFSASAVFSLTHREKLIEKGFLPLKDESCLTNGYLDTVINGIPGLDGMRLKNLPSEYLRTDPYNVIMRFLAEVFNKSYTNSASGVVINTFEELENVEVRELLPMFPKLLTVGPLHKLENRVENNELDSVGANLWEEDRSCLAWLDSKRPESVLLVSFGTTTYMKPEQLIEFAWGLANSEHNFLWVIRSDLVVGDTATLPPGFEAEIKERALLTTWCPQEKVLCHPSIGGYLTHAGWNSVLESMSAGVPLLCWPTFGDQKINSWCCCDKWGIGVEIGEDAKRNEVERLVRELMTGQKGKEMKEKALEWKKKAEEACKTTGSSFINLENLVNLLLSGVGKS